MTDPVSIKGEHFYERKEIENYVRETGVDPNTQEALTVNEIQAEPQLKASIESMNIILYFKFVFIFINFYKYYLLNKRLLERTSRKKVGKVNIKT